MRGMLLPALLLLAHCYQLNSYPYFVDPNAASRVYLALSIADEGSFTIDQWEARYASIQDKALHDGRTYSDKPPGLSFAMAPIAWLLRRTVLGAAGVRAMLVWLRLLAVSIPAALCWLFFLPFFGRLCGGREGGEALVLAGALGTNHFIYATQAMAHVPAGLMLFCVFLLLRSQRPSLRRCALAGFLLAYAFITDYLACGAIPALMVLALRRLRIRQAPAFGLAMLPPLAAWAWYNKICFGGWLSLGSFYHADPAYRAAYNAVWFGMRAPSLAGIFGMLASPSRGLCFLSPFLLLAPWGFAELWKDPLHKEDAAICAGVFLGTLLFAATTVDWKGGWAVGPRYLVPALPFLLVGAAGALRAARRRPVLGGVFIALSLPGLLWIAVSAASFPCFPNQFDGPLAHFAVPLLSRGCVTAGWLTPWAGAWSALPFLAVFAAASWRLVRDLRLHVSACPWAKGVAAACVVAALQCAVPEPSAHRAVQDKIIAAVSWDMGCSQR